MLPVLLNLKRALHLAHEVQTTRELVGHQAMGSETKCHDHPLHTMLGCIAHWLATGSKKRCAADVGEFGRCRAECLSGLQDGFQFVLG